MDIQRTLGNTLTPTAAISVGVGASAANFLAGLPAYINIATATYLTIMIVHKLWQIFKEWRNERNKRK